MVKGRGIVEAGGEEIAVIGVDIVLPNSVEQDSFVRAVGKRQMIKAGRRMGKTVGASIKAVLGFLGYCNRCIGEGCDECEYSGRVRPKRELYAAPTAEQVEKFWYEVCRALAKGIEAGVWKKNETEKVIEVPGTEQRLKAKAQPLSSKIYTPDGVKLMGDIKVGDEVLTPFGTVTEVIGVYPQGEQDIYEFTFGDGCQAKSTIDHLWAVKGVKNSLSSHNQFKVVTTEDLLKNSRINSKLTNISFRPSIRITNSVAFSPKPVPIDPYLLGVLIGDGTLSIDCSPRIATSDIEILDRIRGLLPDGVSIQYAGKYDYRFAPKDKPRKYKNKLLTELKLLGLIGKRSHEKFIPDCYKYNSEDVRVNLLQGILDTDGSVSPEGRAVLSQTSKRLAADVAEVVQSLGGLCSTKKRAAGYKSDGVYHKCKDTYKQFIIYDGKYELFTLQKKLNKWKLCTSKNSSVNRSILTIKLIGREQAQCIRVKDISPFYLTDSFIVTHNTAWNANTLRGDYGDMVILEEFQLMNEDVWGEVVLPMLLDNNGTAVIIYTPPSLKSEGVSKAKDPRHASKLYRKAEKDPKWQTFHFTSFANPDISQEALGELITEMSLDAYRREILAEDDEVEQSWLVYGKFKDELCRIKRFAIPKEWRVISSHDFGKANPAALFAARVQLPLPEGAPPYLRPGDTVIFREYAPGAGSSTPQHIQKFKDFTEGYKIEISVGGNITTEEEIRTGYGAQGWAIAAPPITRVNTQIDRTIGLMESNKLHIFEDLYGLLGQLASCLWELDETNKPLNKIKNESRWHYLAALRYMCAWLPYERPFLTNETNKIKIKVY